MESPSRIQAQLCAALACTLLFFVACQDFPTDMDSGPAHLALESGDAQTGPVATELPDPLAVRVVDAAGSPVSGVMVTWSAAADEGTLPGESPTDASGIAVATWTVGTTAGEQTASASVSGVGSVSFTATAEPGPASRLVTSEDSLTFDALEATASLTAEVEDEHGNAIEGAVEWSSTDADVASVDASGAATANGNGVATLVASRDGVADSVAVRVEQTAAAVAVSGSKTLTSLGDTLRLSASVEDANGHEVAGASVAWLALDTLVASVNNTGLVTARSAGSARIVASADAAADTINVSVDQQVASVTLEPGSPVALVAGDTLTLTATIRDGNSQPVQDAETAWSSSDAAVATVSDAGLVTAVAAGTASIQLTAGGVASNEVEVTVEELATIDELEDGVPVELAGAEGSLRHFVIVVPDPATLEVALTGGTGDADLAVGYGAPVDQVDPADVACVSEAADTNEVCTIVDAAAGEWFIGVRGYSDYEGATLLATLDYGQAVDQVWIEPEAPDALEVGETLAFTATVLDADGEPVTDAEIVWYTSDPEVADIDAEGVVAAVAPGTALIQMTADDVESNVVEVVVVEAGSDVQQLEDGVPVSDLAGDTESYADFWIDVPEGATLEVTLSGGSGDADLYVNYGAPADPEAYECVSDAVGNDELCTIESAAGGAWFIAVFGYEAYSGATLVATLEYASGAVEISAIFPSVLSAGETAVITGSGFSTSASSNEVSVGGVAATVLDATATELTVTVADASSYVCEPTQSVPVAVSVSGASAEAAHPLAVAAQRELGIGEALRLEDAASAACNELVGGGNYVLSVFHGSYSASAQAAFRLVGAGGEPAVLAPVVSSSHLTADLSTAVERELPEELRARMERHNRVLESSHEAFERFGAPQRSPDGLVSAVVLPEVGDIREERMPEWDEVTGELICDPEPIEARVIYVGEHAIVLEDVLSPVAGEMDDVLAAMAAEYEQEMLPVLTQNFGDPVAFDADGDGRIYMLFTPRLNGTGTLGQVWSADLYAPEEIDCAAASQAEIFYATTPESTALIDDWRWEMRATLIHEVKHIVSNAERMAANVYGEDRWLEEATAMISEEIWVRQHYGYGQGTNTTFQESIYCEISGACAEDQPKAMDAHFEYLAAYLAGSEAQSPVVAWDDHVDYHTFYGSGWAFVRWAADHYGGDEAAFFRALTQSADAGIDNLVARTGVPFEQLLGEWVAAMATDDREGFTASDERITMPSWDLRDIYAGYHSTWPDHHTSEYPLHTRHLSYGDFDVAVPSVVGGSAAFFELAGSTNSSQLLALESESGGVAPSLLRLTIVRID